MSDFTSQILDEYARQQKPSWREMYLKDLAVYTQVSSTRNTLEAVERAMRREGIPNEVVRRVLRQVICGEEGT